MNPLSAVGRTTEFAGRRLANAYRRTGADLPFGDPLPSHGCEMEGWFWRVTDAASGRVVVALFSVNRHPDGDWSTAAVALHPGDVVRAAALNEARAEDSPFELTAGSTTDSTFSATVDDLRVDLDDVKVRLRFADSVGWPKALGGGGIASSVPFLNQYWHPHRLGGTASGTVEFGEQRWHLDNAKVYAERNWGAGFPDRWWWGQAHDFGDADVSVAFSGGLLALGPLQRDVAGVVVRLGGRVIRMTPPTAWVRSEVADRRWTLRATSWRHHVELYGDGSHREPHVLPVPLPALRRNAATDFEHLAGRLRCVLREFGRVIFEGQSETHRSGSREPAGAALILRRGRDRPEFDRHAVAILAQNPATWCLASKAAMADILDLTLEQKAALGSGADMWRTKDIGPVAAVTLVDGPHGVRRPTAGARGNLDVSATEPATCFPPAVGLSQTWDPALIERVGEALGDECRALGVDVLLGPGVNIKRDPRCGRNFEYFSEDPLLTGVLGTAWTMGVQSRGVGASLKHFAANDAETDRMRASSDVDVRTLREIHLRAFQRVVQEAQPWTVMCSYNRINGVHTAQNRWLLTDVLRGEWDFDGVVVSDWGAVTDRVAAVAAGLDLEMPGAGGITDADVVAAVNVGTLGVADVDRATQRVAKLSAMASATREDAAGTGGFDVDGHHALAREVAGRAVVLLKNDGDLLPLTGGSIAVIGGFAETPVFQGGGSSHVNPTRVDRPLAEIRRLAGDRHVAFARGFSTDGDHASELVAEAVSAAAAADTAVVFLGLPAHEESEGFDREHLELPTGQLEVVRAIVDVQPRTVVVLSHGGVVRSGPVAELAPAVLDGALLGQAGGGAIADVLFGRVNPSGRLAETVPLRLEDAPSYLNFPGEAGHVVYGERIFVGYRGYDACDRDVAFPFGHGLSYTRFHYADLALDVSGDDITVRVTVTNTGGRSGREVVQVYASAPASTVPRPPRWLVAFGDVTLDAGGSRSVELRWGPDELTYWNTVADAWTVAGGEYVVSVGSSSRDLRLTGTVSLTGDEERAPITAESTFGEVLADPIAGPILTAALSEAMGVQQSAGLPAMGTDVLRLMAGIPLDRAVALSGGRFTREQLAALLTKVNGGGA